ncbi:MAG: DNA photolyase [Candidatus Omnitrophica bacterium]|nr:DNA photolyase [Candidatus Omnitrophota bacterium]
MPEHIWRPDKIYIDEAVADEKRVRQILARVPDVPKEATSEVKELTRRAASKENAFTEGKRALLLTRHKGKFLSVCPAFTDSAVCCTYRTINIVLGCNFDCSYCFLQAYLNNPLTTFYVNVEDMFSELRSLFDSNPEKTFRFGTGEFTDSVSLDHILGINQELIAFFAQYPNAVLELKTKSARVDSLLDLDHRGRTIIAWSVNTKFIQRTEEHKTATIEERIGAAKKCVETGYRVAFHFDPLILHEGWETGYRETVRLMREEINPESIAWISYGSLRFLSPLKQEAQKRFPATPIFSGEFVKGFDGKMRYFAPLRTRLYQTIHRYVQESFPLVTPYICMEPEHVWEKSLGLSDISSAWLTDTLDISAKALNGKE